MIIKNLKIIIITFIVLGLVIVSKVIIQTPKGIIVDNPVFRDSLYVTSVNSDIEDNYNDFLNLEADYYVVVFSFGADGYCPCAVEDHKEYHDKIINVIEEYNGDLVGFIIDYQYLDRTDKDFTKSLSADWEVYQVYELVIINKDGEKLGNLVGKDFEETDLENVIEGVINNGS